MYIVDQPIILWEVIVTVLHSIAILSTTLRLWYRYHKHRLWMDDYTAIPAMLMNVINATGIWMMYIKTSGDAKPGSKVALYWSMSISWYTIIWFTRISLALSTIRVFSAWGTFRRCARGVSIAFATVYIGLMSWLFTTSCTTFEVGAMKGVDFLNCNSERYSLTLTGTITDIGACAILFLSSVYMLWQIPLTREQTILALTLLGANTAVLLSAALFCTFAYSPNISGPGRPIVVGMSSQIEAAVSVVCCNLLVVVAYMYRDDVHSQGIDDTIAWKKPTDVEKGKPSAAALLSQKNKQVADDLSPHQNRANKHSMAGDP
ncbi:hypothetical protein B0H34DRAFT_468990 [Crassisporium funariophilum]|nr:hypothetical protein B0H34DRAFT_468990 [Crassisporium funariophilum]